MSTSLEAVTTAALQLTVEQRAELAERLFASIEPPMPLHPNWEGEIARRVADLDSGRATSVPAEKVFAEIRGLIDKHNDD